MKSVAYFEPIHGINAYGRELLPHLAQYYNIDIFTNKRNDHLDPLVQDVVDSFHIYPYEDFNKQKRYYHLIFQLRNIGTHVPVYDLLIENGGVSVFHDVNISGILSAKTLMHGQKWAFLKDILQNEGARAFILTSLNVLVRKQWPKENRYFMNKTACRHSRGIIVHNLSAQQALEKFTSSIPVAVIQRGVPEVECIEQKTARQRLGLPSDAFLLVSLGVVAPKKRIHQILHAFARLIEQVPNALYVLVGSISENFDIQNTIQDMGLEESVIVTGYASEEMFKDYLSAADICVTLRYPVEGETSSVALRSMSYGKPTLISDAGSMQEWPGDICVKIKPDNREIDSIYQALYSLSQDPVARRALGERARMYTLEHHTWSGAACAYYHFLESLK